MFTSSDSQTFSRLNTLTHMEGSGIVNSATCDCTFGIVERQDVMGFVDSSPL